MRFSSLVLIFSAFAVFFAPCRGSEPPKMLLQQAPDSKQPVGFAIMRHCDGKFSFYDRLDPNADPLRLPDRRGKVHTLRPGLPRSVANNGPLVDSTILNNQQVILTKDEEVVSVFVKREEIDRSAVAEIGLPRYLNVWVQRAGMTQVSAPNMIWRGYNGSQMEYQQLASSRILVPFGSLQPHAKTIPPYGRHQTVIQYSDDGGATWHESSSKLVSPCYAGFNGNNEGACEPAIEPLDDGTIWMLMRTQAGFLYESLSSDDGTTWSPATASRFNTSTGPPNILRLASGDLVVTWNNCEMPPRADGKGVYGGRDALHIAISSDDGKTWRGFREIYLDHRRNDNPAKSGDRGTAYPLGAYTSDDKIVILAGQGKGGRNPILIDPNWIIATESQTDFSNGSADWSVYKHHGPAQRWWRGRVVGCEVVQHPKDPSARCLHVRRPDELPADGATWNFPNAWIGEINTRIMLPAGSSGAIISLADRFFDPVNDAGESLAVFGVGLNLTDGLGETTLNPDQWYDLTLRWDLNRQQCDLSIKAEPAVEPIVDKRLALKNRTINGLSYIRFRSAANEIDLHGILVDSVRVTVQDPSAPPVTAAERREHEQRYIDTVVPEWARQM